jgi:hypothetical protein
MEIGKIIPFLEENKYDIKIHCAIGPKNKLEALIEFSKGKFKYWQEGQRQKNFEKKYIFSIIYLKKDEWLFAGIYKIVGLNEIQIGTKVRGYIRPGKYLYDTELLDYGKDLIGKLVINFEKDFRASYLLMEKHLDKLTLCEIRRQEYKFDPFPGYTNVHIQFDMLKEIIGNNEISWETALSNVKGVYLISDTFNGKLYIGSASGNKAFWQRWAEYAKNGHGNNKLLIEVISKNGKEYCSNFTFSILEIFGLNAMDDEILNKESFWKERLLTRKFGYNDN